MQRARYDDEFRARAVARSEEVGVLEAAKELGVRSQTLRSWRTRAGIATLHTAKTAAATEAHKASGEERRFRLGERLLELAEKSTEQAERLIADASLRDLVGALDYAIKNAQLLTGQATARTEHAGGREAAVGALDELAARRKKAA